MPEPTSAELRALRVARGGFSTSKGTALHDLFEQMAERGWVKEATLTAGGVAWRLSGEGLELAYAD